MKTKKQPIKEEVTAILSDPKFWENMRKELEFLHDPNNSAKIRERFNIQS